MALFDDASLVVTPNGYKEGTLYSIKPTSGLGDMTVVRATTATRVNSAGLIELVPYNLLTWSQDFSNANWVKSNGPTMTYNSAIAPNGTMTATGIKADDATNFKSIYQSIGSISPNSTFTYSIYVKKETSETFFGGISVYLTGGTTKVFYGIVNAVSGTVTLSGGSITPTITVVDLGTYWRIICTLTDNGANTNVLFEYYATLSTNGTTLGQGIGSVRTIWGAQLVTGTLPKDYLRTETRLNIPRLDYSNGSCPSLLVEPQRTNMLSYSSQFDNGYWNKQNSTITANSIVSPDGTTNADALIASNGTGIFKGVYITEYTSAPKSFSFFAKKGNKDWAMLIGYNGTNNVWFNVANGTIGTIGSNFVNAKIENYGNGWYRCSATLNASTAILLNIGLYVSDADNSTSCTGDGSTTSMYFWGAQMEAGAYPTSYIPTTSAAVTRNADAIYKTGISSLIGQTQGTLFAEIVRTQSTATDSFWINISDNSSNNWIFMGTDATLGRFYVRASSTTIVDQYPAISLGRHKLAIGYQSGSIVGYVDGVQIFTSSATFTLNSLTGINFGYSGALITGAVNTSGQVNQAILFPTRLTNAELASLTTL